MPRNLPVPVSGILLTVGTLLGSITAHAQDQEPIQDTRLYSLVNLATPELPDPKRGIYNLDIRAVGGKENKTYFGIGGIYGLRPDFAVFARATFSDKRFFAASPIPVPVAPVLIPTGGTEWEVGAKWRFLQRGDVEAAVQGGLLHPNNARGSDPMFAGQVQVSRRLGSKTSVYLVPKVLLGNRSIFTLGGGVSYRFNSDWLVFGDLQGPIGTDNTYSTNSGRRIGQEVWGAGFRYSPEAYGGRVSLDLGATNGLGQTTGYSMQPGLSGSAAFFLNFLYRL